MGGETKLGRVIGLDTRIKFEFVQGFQVRGTVYIWFLKYDILCLDSEQKLHEPFLFTLFSAKLWVSAQKPPDGHEVTVRRCIINYMSFWVRK